MAELSKRKYYAARRGSLFTERSSWVSHWKDISEHLLPRNGRFLTSDRNRGEKKHNKIYDSTGTRALRVMAAGLMAGMTSPARPWFRLAIPDRALMEKEPVKLWLHKLTVLMRDIFSRSNTYRSLHSIYEELGAFGTAVDLVLPNFDFVVHHTPLTVGEYAIATDHLGNVTTIYREFDKTVVQVVEEFGREHCSAQVKNLYDTGKGLDTWITLGHVIEPRRKMDIEYGKKDRRNMPITSCYFEVNSQEEKFLDEGGFKRMPGIAARWSVAGGDIYGNGPGMEALGDIKQLQHQQLRKGQGIDYMVKPVLQAPSSMKGQEADSLPGGILYTDMMGANGGVKSAWDVGINLSHLLADIEDVRKRINGAFFADLFMMLANDERSGITAREIVERHEEKLLMLGPVLERLHNELLNPLIDITFDRIIDAGLMPTPPQEMQGADINVEFVSVLAQAQRAVGTQSVDRLLGTVGAIAALKPEVIDKIDADQIVDEYADMLGVDPSLIVADEKVAIIRADRAKQQQQQMAMAAAPVMADTAKKLASADTEGKNALTDVMGRLSGYTAAA